MLFRIGCMVKVSPIPIPSSCAILLLTHPSHKVFFKEGSDSLFEDLNFWQRSFDTRGRSCDVFSYGKHSFVLLQTSTNRFFDFNFLSSVLFFLHIFCVQEGVVMHLNVSFHIFFYYNR